MESGVARFASLLPVAQTNVLTVSSSLQSICLVREPEFRLKWRNCLGLRTSNCYPVWQLPDSQVSHVPRNPQSHGSTKLTWHSTGALSDMANYFNQNKPYRRCMQGYGISDLPFSEEPRCFWLARRHVNKITFGRCMSSGIAEIQDAMTVYWRPALEEILFVSGIALASLAGISLPSKTAQRSFVYQFWRKETSQGQNSRLPYSDVKTIKDKHQAQTCYFSEDKMWGTLQEKIEAAALQLQSDDAVDSAAREKFHGSTLILEAIASGPRLRLLLSTIEFLRNEFKVRGSAEQGYHPKEILDMLSSSINPIFQKWLCHEDLIIKLEDEKPRDVFLGSTHSSFNKSQDQFFEKNVKLMRNSTPYSQHTKSAAINVGVYARLYQEEIMSGLVPVGKVQLYADFFFLIYSGSLRSGSCCSRKFLLKYTEAILEDVVIRIADRVAEHYVNLMSKNACDGDEWPLLLLPEILSTRSLESLRNQIALQKWFQQSFKSVSAIYEDRMELCTLQVKHLVESAEKLPHKGKKRLRVLDHGSGKGQTEMIVARCFMPMKRSKELNSLSGWRYYYSLYLEFSDIAGPVLKVVLSKLGEGISFLLVSLIGRSLGLIFRGIRQSIQWSSK